MEASVPLMAQKHQQYFLILVCEKLDSIRNSLPGLFCSWRTESSQIFRGLNWEKTLHFGPDWVNA